MEGTKRQHWDGIERTCSDHSGQAAAEARGPDLMGQGRVGMQWLQGTSYVVIGADNVRMAAGDTTT